MSNLIISAIAAMDENRVIGYSNQLPWYLPADLAHFKQLTLGHPVLMGRKTYLSIGKPLPQRTNIILSHNPAFKAEGCIVITSMDSAIQHAVHKKSKELFIIGGADIYKNFLPLVQRIYLTIIHHSFQGDAYFPELNAHEWREAGRSDHEADEKNPYAYSFLKLERQT